METDRLFLILFKNQYISKDFSQPYLFYMELIVYLNATILKETNSLIG